MPVIAVSPIQVVIHESPQVVVALPAQQGPQGIPGDLATARSKHLTYTDGVLTGVSDSQGTKTFVYTDGLLTSIIGTGVYASKTLTYDAGVLTDVTVL